ncbi:hypothetical protein M422DRAFT_113853, partial [Sphaerobolus stellatus SS14]
WLQTVDPAATSPQRIYSVVAHNAPASAWDGNQESMQEVITRIEASNTADMDPATLYPIARLTWLNGRDTRDRTQHGPLKLDFKSRKDANFAIDQGLTIEGTYCRVSIYIPRAPQCFRCQDWGHRATECAGEARCGKCAGSHETTHHMCVHDNPCAPGERC